VWRAHRRRRWRDRHALACEALHEEGLFDHRFGELMKHNLADYHVPTNADVYDIEVIFVDEHDDKVSPLGVKGVGEIGLVAVATAIANAVFQATGRRVRERPITRASYRG
jgi:xanthine dehydrogenase YagR molybdenum-binding subunit